MQYMCYSAVQQPLARSGSNSGGSGSCSGTAVPIVNAAMRPITSIRLRTAAMARARDTCPVLSTATQSLGQPAMQLDHGGCTCLHTTVHIHTYTSLAAPPHAACRARLALVLPLHSRLPLSRLNPEYLCLGAPHRSPPSIASVCDLLSLPCPSPHTLLSACLPACLHPPADRRLSILAAIAHPNGCPLLRYRAHYHTHTRTHAPEPA